MQAASVRTGVARGVAAGDRARAATRIQRQFRAEVGRAQADRASTEAVCEDLHLVRRVDALVDWTGLQKPDVLVRNRSARACSNMHAGQSAL